MLQDLNTLSKYLKFDCWNGTLKNKLVQNLTGDEAVKTQRPHSVLSSCVLTESIGGECMKIKTRDQKKDPDVRFPAV